MLGLAAFGVYLLYRKVAQPQTRSVNSEANRASSRNSGGGGPDSDTILAKDCEAFEQSVNENPRDVFAWVSWGGALARRAAGKSRAESDRLSALADEKYSAALVLAPDDMKLAGNLAGVVFHLGTLRGGSEGRQLLIRACDLCERIIGHSAAATEGNSTLRRHVLLVWGAALDWLGRRTGLPGADRFYFAAEEKYAAALTVGLNDLSLGRGGARTILHWAVQHPGEASRRLLMEACRESDKVLRKTPGDTDALVAWGWSRALLAHKTRDTEADSLYSEVEKGYSTALRLNPANADIQCCLAHVLMERAEMREAAAGDEFLERASTLLEMAVQASPEHIGLLCAWTRVLNFRALRMPGDETNRLLDQACQQFQRYEEIEDPGNLLWAGGTLLWARGRATKGEESAQLLQEAKAKYAELESWATGSAAYDLACVCAELQDGQQCRYWLQESREPGVRISADAMARDAALHGVRECEWFVRLLAG